MTANNTPMACATLTDSQVRIVKSLDAVVPCTAGIGVMIRDELQPNADEPVINFELRRRDPSDGSQDDDK
ncbi:uncharacterized protein PgNI_09457 [Pyricularia grisea]|uniref:Uncharacterized protein n=1 Tax=Pyricularia grisea TaxID=148305 RepID=A0A6P8AT23_PYRGI|nr:uncharacterized protein PgNI_09457 [Pyricularia grisea]TLD05247.1 hypothetical protein PgNI_09457 [Pyricularia grisea]